MINPEYKILVDKARLRAMLDHSRDMSAIVDASGRILAGSSGSDRGLGYTLAELRSTNGLEYVHPDDRARVREEFLELRGIPGATRRTALRCRDRAHTWREVSVVASNRLHDPAVAGILLTITDVTRERELVQQLWQSQKMEALGRMAAGVVHDFNNILTGITNYNDFVIQSLPEGSPVRADAEEVALAARRAISLTGQLLMFSRQQAARPQRVNAHAVIREMEPLLSRLVGPSVNVLVAVVSDLPLIAAVPMQLEQVLLNLVTNARDAMPEGGDISIVAMRANQPRSGAPAVMLAVADDGCGMDALTQSRAFEPFFTNKASGDGTGLGLSIVYGIVTDLGGEITIESSATTGTVLRVYIPVYSATDASRVDEWCD